MIRILYLALLGFTLFLYGLNIDVMHDAPLLMRLGLHLFFGSATVGCAWCVIVGGP